MSEVLTPAEIHNAEFHVTVRGYARDEVREYLAAIAEIVERLQEKADAGYLNLGERMGGLLQGAKDAADELLAAAHSNAARVEEEAGIRATDIVETAERHATKIVQEAELRVVELRSIEEAIRAELRTLRENLEQVVVRVRPLEQTSGQMAGNGVSAATD